MRHHHSAGRIQVVALSKAPRKADLFLGGQQRHPIDGLDIGINAADTAWMQHESVRRGRDQRGGSSGRTVLGH
jgi:hypothetical protein